MRAVEGFLRISGVRGCRLILVALSCAFVGDVLADECDQLPPPSVTLKRIEEAVTLDTTLGYRDLGVLAASLARPNARVLGLTRGKIAVRFDARTAYYVERTQRWECASPQLTVSYGFSPVTVYVAREIPQGSCAYDAVYRHEQQHVKIYHDHLVAIEKRLAEALQNRFSTGKPWRGPVGETRARLQRELDERWIPFFEREIGQAEPAQAAIDTPEQYARVAASCNGEIERLMR